MCRPRMTAVGETIIPVIQGIGSQMLILKQLLSQAVLWRIVPGTAPTWLGRLLPTAIMGSAWRASTGTPGSCLSVYWASAAAFFQILRMVPVGQLVYRSRACRRIQILRR